MSRINLEKLVSQRDISSLIDKFFAMSKVPLGVFDADSNLLLGQENKNTKEQHPITLEEKVIGWVKGNEASLLLASFLSLAAMREYEKKELARETLAKYRDLMHLYTLGEKLSLSLSSQEIAQLAAKEALSIFGAGNTSIMVSGEKKGLFRILAAAGAKTKQQTILRIDQGIAGRVLKTGKPEIVNDVSLNPHFVQGGNNISALMCAPLKTKDAVMGVFNVSSHEPHTYSSEDIKLLTSIATLVSSALTNSLLYEQLNSYSEELSSKNIQLEKEIAERELSEKALRESEEKYRLHFDNAIDVIYSVNPDLVIASISPSLEKVLGYKPEEVMNKPFSQLNMLTPKSLEKAYADAKRIFSGERIDSAKYEFIAKDGLIKIGEVSSAPLYKDGKVVSAISVARDVTEREKTLEKLAESEERFRTMAESIMDGLVIAEKGKIVFVNKKVTEITGYTADELIERSQGLDFVVPEQQEEMAPLHQEVLKKGFFPKPIEVWINRKDGAKRCVSKQLSLSTKGGEVVAGYEVITDITERKRAEDQLKETTEFLNNVIESSLDAIIITDYGGFITRVNKAFLNLLAYSQEEVIGKHATEFIAFTSGTYTSVTGEEISLIEEDQYSDAQKKIYDVFYKEGKIPNWEYYLLRKDGMIVPVEQNMIALRNERGEIIGAVGIARDITERRIAQGALIKSEERFRTMADSITNGLIIMEEGKIVYVNRRATEITGYSQEELMKVWCPDLVITEDAEWKDEIISEIQKTGVWPEKIDTWMRRKDGSKCCVNLRFSFSSREKGTVYAGYVLITDITESRLAEEKLRDTTEFLNNIIESSQDSIVITDPVGNLTRVNQYFLKKLGYTQEEVFGKHVGEFAPSGPGRHELVSGGWVEILEDYFENQKLMIDVLYKDGKVENWEAYYRHKDGKLILIEQNLFFLRDLTGEKIGSVGILRDITERKKAEEQLKETTTFLDNVIESSQDFIIVTTPEGYLTRVNRSLLDALGYKQDEMLGKHPVEFAPQKGETYKSTTGEYLTIGKEVYDNAMNAMFEMVEKGLLHNWEFFLLRKDKTIIPVEENIAYLYDDQGKKIGAVGILRDITERKKAEQQLKETTAFLDNIIASSLDSIVVSDNNGNLERVNKAFLQLLNLEENQVLGKMMSELSVTEEGEYETVYGAKIKIGKDHINYMMTMLSQFIAEGKIVDWKSYVFRNDGKIIPVEVSIVKLYNEKGETIGSVGVVRDVTERRKAEREITETTDFLENIIASSRDPIIIGDEVGIIVRTNKAFQELLHYEADEVVGKHIGEFVPVEKGSYESRAGTMVELDDKFFQDAEKKMTELVEKGSVDVWQSCYLGKDGKIVPVEQTISFLYDKFGERTGVVGISRDITDRLKAEQEVIRTRDFLQDIFKTSLDGIMVTDALSNIKMVNSAAVKILGYPRKELLGSKTQKFLQSGDEVEERGKAIQKVLMKKGFLSGYEHKWIRKDGTAVDLEISLALLKDRNGNLSGSVLSFRDISERKKAEQRLIESREQLRSLASQLTLTEERERRRIATDLHDRIGQALAISKIKLGALRESTSSLGLCKDVDGVRDLIEQTIQDTRSLIFDLCPPFLYELGFEKAIEWLLEDIQNQHGITTHFKSDGKPKQFDDDIRVLLYQTIRELFVNIVKHAEAENAGLTIKRDDHTISLCVEDDGLGFDEGATPFRMQKEGGFGLFRIQERFNYLGGEIQIKSKPGKGTKIFLRLPFKIDDPTKKERGK